MTHDPLLELVKRGSAKRLREHLATHVCEAMLLAEALRRTLLKRATAKALALLDAGADPLLGDGESTRALAYAAMGGDPALIRKILSRDPDASQTNTKGRTPLIWAASFGRVEAAALLLDAGADPDVVPQSGAPAIVEAAAGSHPAVVALLASRVARVDAVDEAYGKTPLMYAAEKGWTDIVGALVEAGARVDRRDNYGLAPLHYAVRKGHGETVETLLAAGADPAQPSTRGQTALHMAMSCPIDIVARLLAGGCPTDTPDADGLSPLMHACRAGNDTLVNRFLQAGATSQPQVDHGPSALQEAILGGHVSTVALLLATPGTRVDYPCRKPGWTPLITAARVGEAAIAALLLDHGADIERSDSEGRTPALHAAACSRATMLELLFHRGADRAAQDRRGVGTLMLAARSGVGSESAEPAPESVFIALAAGLDPKRSDALGNTALHYAVDGGSVEVAALLLDAGADPNAADSEGLTPLTKATAIDYMDERASRPTNRKTDRMAPLIDILLAAGADPEAPSRIGTPLELARSLRCPGVVRDLERAVKRRRGETGP